MCFENLPIVFDEDETPHLDLTRDFRTDGAEPRAEPSPPPPEAKGVEFSIDPVTRVAGALAYHTTVDLGERVVTSADSPAVLFRGYELILRGRDPREAIDISSRACGICGGVHSTCSAMALEMTFGATPPPLVVVARNLAEAAVGQTAPMRVVPKQPEHVFDGVTPVWFVGGREKEGCHVGQRDRQAGSHQRCWHVRRAL